MSQWQDADPDEPVGINCTILLGQPAVIGVHHGFVGAIILNSAPKLRSPLLRREQNLRIDAVLILFPDPLLRGTGSRSAFIFAAKRNVFIPSFATIEVC